MTNFFCFFIFAASRAKRILLQLDVRNGRMNSMFSGWITTRRRFIGYSAAFSAAGPFVALAADDPVRSVYETSDGRATSSVWCRRAYLDLAGRIPTMEEAKAFAADVAPDKRSRLVDKLLASEDFADYWAMRYCDILRVKSEFPINLWPNAVYVYHRRIRESVAKDESWLDFARSLLAATGSNFRDPETNFLRASAKRTAEGLSEVAALTFLGEPTAEFAEYFASVTFKSTREWKEEIVYLEPGGRTPDEFAARLAGDLNGRFAAAHASRVWQWIFCAPPSQEQTKELAQYFAKDGFRLKPFLRRIMLSDSYAQGSVTGSFPVRRLDAEVLDDAICSITGAKREYQSIAPEPFTFLPPERKSVLIEDGSISNAFLLLFGRPARDSGLMTERHNDVTAKQRLYLFNSGRLYARLGRLTDGKAFHKRSYTVIFEELYWRFLGRPPAAFEKTVLERHLRQAKKISGKAQWRLPKDVAWCLINSSEFLFRI